MKNIINAILLVMQDVKNLQKDKVVGRGSNSYKSVTGAKVRSTLRVSMIKNGLVILQNSIEYTEEVAVWEEVYNQQPKRKQQVRLTAKVKYTLLHTSGESIPLEGIGTGVDSQDKAAGKATSYALKYVLLNLFLVPTGLDPDDVHSDEIEVAPEPKKAPEGPKKVSAAQWPKVLEYASQSKEQRDKALKAYNLTAKQAKALKDMYITNIETSS